MAFSQLKQVHEQKFQGASVVLKSHEGTELDKSKELLLFFRAMRVLSDLPQIFHTPILNVMARLSPQFTASGATRSSKGGSLWGTALDTETIALALF